MVTTHISLIFHNVLRNETKNPYIYTLQRIAKVLENRFFQNRHATFDWLVSSFTCFFFLFSQNIGDWLSFSDFNEFKTCPFCFGGVDSSLLFTNLFRVGYSLITLTNFSDSGGGGLIPRVSQIFHNSNLPLCPILLGSYFGKTNWRWECRKFTKFPLHITCTVMTELSDYNAMVSHTYYSNYYLTQNTEISFPQSSLFL